MRQGGDLSQLHAGSFIRTFEHALIAQYDPKHSVFYAPYVSSFSFRFVALLLFNFACSGAPEKFKWQARHDTVRLNNTHFQRRRGPDGKSVNPCEKSRGRHRVG